MDHPYYSVTVTSLTEGWSYTGVEGVDHDPDADWVLLEPFRYAWSREDEVLPSQLAPSTLSVTIAARSLALCPPVSPGDLISFTLRLGVAGPVLAQVGAMRVGQPVHETDLNQSETWPVTLTFTATDQLAELSSLTPVRTTTSERVTWERIAQIAAAMGRSIGSPNADGRGQNTAQPRYTAEWPPNARDALTSWVWSDKRQYVVTPWRGGSYPAGYGWVGTGITVSGGPFITPTPAADPNSTQRYLLVNDSLGATTQPLLAQVAGGVFTALPRVAGSHAAAIHGDHCEFPLRLRKGREHLPNAARIAGWSHGGANLDEKAYVAEYSTADVQSNGARTREVPVQIILGVHDPNSAEAPVNQGGWAADVVAVGAAVVAPDANYLETQGQFDAFEIRPARMLQAVANVHLPLLTPSYPGEGGDGRIRRHVTLYGVDPAAMPGSVDTPLRGDLVAGTVTVQDGELVYTITTTPSPGPTVDRLTFAEFEAMVGGLTTEQIDPSLTFADLYAMSN